MARATARRSAASSPRVELTNTRRRWSGLRITTLSPSRDQATLLRPGGGYRLPLAEPGPGGERLVEPLRAERLAELGHQFGLGVAQRRPHPQAGPPPQALGRPGQPRRAS